MLRSRHLLGIADLDAEEIQRILDTAEAMKEIAARPIKKVPTLRGRTVVNLFFEPSTRTRTSIDEAIEGADVVMMLRIQHERMHGHFIPSTREYFTLFGLTPERLRRAKD